MIGVVGAGAFGTALAIALSQANTPVKLWTRSASQARNMTHTRRNGRYLPDATFPQELNVTANLDDLSTADVLLLAIPLQNLRNVATSLDGVGAPLVACCKGIEVATGLGPTAIIQEVQRNATAAILTGPSFAADIAIGRPTALTLACQDDDICAALQKRLTTATLRLYRTNDTIGAELGGALKNVMAIACGAVMGAGLGDSARAATMTRGFAEMQRIGAAFGAKPETLSGLSGLGDLALTCTSPLSRNYRLGLSLGKGAPFDDSITVEGAATARAMRALAQEHAIDAPITKSVTELLDGTVSISDAITELMTRPLKEE